MVARKVAEAHDGANESVAITRRLAEKDRQNANWMRNYIDSLNIQAMVLDEKGDSADGRIRPRSQSMMAIAAMPLCSDSSPTYWRTIRTPCSRSPIATRHSWC